MKPVLHLLGLKGYSARKKPLIQKKHKNDRLQFTNNDQAKDINFYRHVLWFDETNAEPNRSPLHLKEKGEAYKPENTIPTLWHGAGSIMLWCCFAAAGTGAIHKIDGIIRREHYMEILR